MLGEAEGVKGVRKGCREVPKKERAASHMAMAAHFFVLAFRCPKGHLESILVVRCDAGWLSRLVPAGGGLKLLSLADPPTVICCGNDEMAVRVYGILRTRGVRVPEQVSVAGYDNHSAIAETLFPSLTSTELPYMRMGALAAEILFDIIETKETVRPPVRVVGETIWRQSVTALK